MDREKLTKVLAEARIKAGGMGLNAVYFDFEIIDAIIALLKEQDEIIKRYAHFIGKFTDPDVEEQPCPPMPTGGDVNGKT